jgi:hypothetical protein
MVVPEVVLKERKHITGEELQEICGGLDECFPVLEWMASNGWEQGMSETFEDEYWKN